MRSIHGMGVSLAIVALLGACASGGQSSSQPSAAPSAGAAPAAPGLVLSAQLLGNSPGQVRMSPGSDAGRTEVTIAVRGGRSGEGFAWQIKRGMCSNAAGAVEVGRPTLYPTLTVRGDGEARFSGSIKVAFPQGAPHFVEVTRSRSDDTVIACGDLRPGGA